VLAAFDDALLQAGVANHNLIRLSSVIPPASELRVRQGPTTSSLGAWGDRLYVVMAEQRESRPGQEAWAGIGWVQEESTGRGLFVEHEGHDETWLHEQIHASLGAMARARPQVDFGPVQSVVRGGPCEDLPICALAVAVFAAEPWRDQTIDLRDAG
jgi:arginine decarboxylase